MIIKEWIFGILFRQPYVSKSAAASVQSSVNFLDVGLDFLRAQQNKSDLSEFNSCSQTQGKLKQQVVCDRHAQISQLFFKAFYQVERNSSCWKEWGPNTKTNYSGGSEVGKLTTTLTHDDVHQNFLLPQLFPRVSTGILITQSNAPVVDCFEPHNTHVVLNSVVPSEPISAPMG